MTCIVGLKHKGKVYIGADSLGSNGFIKTIRTEPKVFKNGDYLIGGTSSFRMLNLLQWKFNPPTFKDGDNLHRFMCLDFVDAVRKLFVDNGYCISTGDWESGVFLVGTQGRLFRIDTDFQVSEHDVMSCGSGEYHALGCMYALSKKKPEEAIIKSLECAEHHIISVQRPFVVESI